MSTHAVKVVEISELKPIPGADAIELVPIGNWQAIVKKGQFKVGDKGVYIEPDYVVDTTRPEFAFLDSHERTVDHKHRLKAVRMKGVLSLGLLIPLPYTVKAMQVGDNVMEALNIERYVPEVTRHEELTYEEQPGGYTDKFDIESLNNYDWFTPGMEVIVTEKLEGANAKYRYQNGRFFRGSRSMWMNEGMHLWKQCSELHPWIEAWCRRYEDYTIYGEIYGNMRKCMKYGREDIQFAAFAALTPQGNWVNQPELFLGPGIEHTPPVLYIGPYFEGLKELAEQDSMVAGAPAGHKREGIVIVPKVERRTASGDRLILKHVSSRYWEGKK